MKQHSTFVVIFFGQLLLVLITWLLLYVPVTRMQLLWQQEQKAYLETTTMLTEVSQSMGYGGLIHHFKNFVIRRDIHYFEQANSAAVETADRLDKLVANLNVEQAKNHLVAIRKVIQEYDAQLQWMAQNLQAVMNMPVDALDKQVKVDDSNAFSAISALRQELNLQLSIVTNDLADIKAKYLRQLIFWSATVSGIYWAVILPLNSIYKRFRQNFQQLEAIFRLSPLAMMLLDDKGCVVQANDSFRKMFAVPNGLSLNETRIETFVPERYRKMHEFHRSQFQQSKNSAAMEDRTKEFIALAMNGREFPIEIAISSMEDRALNHALAIIKDRTQELQLKERADFDYLTHIHNRRAAEAQLEKELSRLKRYKEAFSILLIDIDHFKQVNDTLGHDAGDQVLLKVVRLLESNLRESDLLGRWGGDEFICLLPNTDDSGAEFIASKLVEIIAQAFMLNEVATSLSIGVTTVHYLQNAREVLINADRALYAAKSSGRNCYRIY